jgi:hypothetical protein
LCSFERFSNYELGIFVLYDNAEDRNRQNTLFRRCILRLGALLNVMLFNKHKHIKYTESATPYAVKCKKENYFSRNIPWSIEKLDCVVTVRECGDVEGEGIPAKS